MTKLTENERKALNNACARLRETNLGTKIGNIEDFLDIDILKTDANTVSKAIDELFDKWANPLLNITVPPPGFFTLAGDAEGNLWCYCNDETNPPIFEHDETTGDLYLNIASEDGANSYQVHVGNYIAVKHLNDYYKKTEIDSKLGGKSNVGHNHDEMYYTETEIDAKVNNINSQINSLIGSTDTTVDLSGYVTKTEMNTQLANKANINHSHLSRDIEINPDVEDGIWASEYGINSQTDVNCYVYDHEKKLENIDDGANKTVVDSSLSSSSTNPVQNKVIKSALDGKSNYGHEHSSDEIHYAYDQNVSVTTILENKAAKNHTHNYIPSTVTQDVFGNGGSQVTATRQGNVVTLRLLFVGEFLDTWKQWCTITDSKYLPDTDGDFTDFGITSSYGKHMLLRINSDGRVRTGYGGNATTSCYQTITFLKNN